MNLFTYYRVNLLHEASGKKCFGKQNRNKRYNIISAAIKNNLESVGRKFSHMEIECLPFTPKQDIALQWTASPLLV